ncbi:hypothetical protein VFPFJ_05239 [Purpureocillium lilacinum]|uniref:Uncharacterized protein n=1 Tax=Purpureocillium lilacinum TaxID=33203 RepID=A0A179HNQ5_PURLI|nr:hypothetical protein VFPFJ_05239 [Purpureocillium lilacinum]OAQ91080.1 hypothetical protein VFPFJ_05239 [Purpureocillium lilacinum]
MGTHVPSPSPVGRNRQTRGGKRARKDDRVASSSHRTPPPRPPFPTEPNQTHPPGRSPLFLTRRSRRTVRLMPATGSCIVLAFPVVTAAFAAAP